jgi:hypothetical protein
LVWVNAVDEMARIHEVYMYPGKRYLYPSSGGPYPSLYDSLADVPRVTAADVGSRVFRIPPNFISGSDCPYFLTSVDPVVISDPDGLEVTASGEWACTKYLVDRTPDLIRSFTDDQKRDYIREFLGRIHGDASTHVLAGKLQAELDAAERSNVLTLPVVAVDDNKTSHAVVTYVTQCAPVL